MSIPIAYRKYSLRALAVLLFAMVSFTTNASLFTIKQAGFLIIEPGGAGCSRGATDATFGIDVGGKQWDAFTMYGTGCSGPRVNMGYFAAGTQFDFYHTVRSMFGGTEVASSRDLGTGRARFSDREVFLDRDNSLGFGGSIIQELTGNRWILHMDDAGSGDDDDNDLSVTLSLKLASSLAMLDSVDARLNDFFCGPESSGAPSSVSFSPTRAGLGRLLYSPGATSKDFSGDLRATVLTPKGKAGDEKWSAANMLDTKSTPMDRVILTSRTTSDECEASTKKKHSGSMSARRGIPFRWNDLASTQREDLSFSWGGAMRFQQSWGKPGYGDSLFSLAGGIATDTDGNIYAADTYNHGIQKFDATGRFIARWGKRGPRSKWWSRGTYGKFSYPQWVATDKDNNVYVTEYALHRIQKFDSSGNLLATWGGYGKGPGQFHNPMGIATDSKGYVYVADNRNNRIQKFDSTGKFVWARGEMGTRSGKFFGPMGVAVGPGDIVYVTDMRNHRVQKFTSSRAYLGKWGKKGSKENELFYPMGITTDRDGNVYVADMRNNRVQKFNADGNFLQSIGRHGSGDGEFDGGLHGIAVTYQSHCSEPDILVTSNNRVQRFSTAVEKVTEEKAKARLEYLRGDRTNEGKGYLFRPRSSVLGDIVHSKAIHVGAPRAYRTTEHTCTAGAVSQRPGFVAKHKKRTGVVYVGANDGALHGFRADSGQEVLAYLPDNLFSRESRKGYHYLTEPGYKHRYYVDGTPFVGDAFIKGTAGDRQWQTVLLGSEGAGGRGLFALNVTNPDSFSEANAEDIVMWEFSDQDDPHLGYTFARPTIALMPNCRWAAIVGNGYADTALDETAGQSQLFIIYLDGGIDGVWTLGKDYIRIPTGVGSRSNRNGLSTPSVVDLNRDGVADRGYAGDLHGNLWVFDFTSPDPNDWVRNKKLLFSAGTKQPITVRPVVTRHPVLRTSTGPDLMVFFGTGQYHAKNDHRISAKQSFYAVTDSGRGRLTKSNLVPQQVLKHTLGSEHRITDSTLEVNYEKYDGWYLALPGAGERVVTDAYLRNGLVHFNTLNPSGKEACPTGSSGWMMSLKIKNGGNPIEHDFRKIGGSLIAAVTRGDTPRLKTDAETMHYSGIKSKSGMGILSGPIVVNGRRYTSGMKTRSADELVITRDPNSPKRVSGRLSWTQLFPRQS